MAPRFGAEQLGVDDVLAVERQRHPGHAAAEGTNGHALDVAVLGAVLPDHEGLAARHGGRVADGQGADLAGGVQVALEQQRRHAQQVGDVVEAVARFVGRQQRDRIDLEVQQILDGVGVLHAVQAVDHRPARVHVRDGLAIEDGLERAEKGLGRRLVGPRRSCRRHHADAHFPDDFLEQVAVLIRTRRIDVLQRQAAGLQPVAVARHTVAGEDLIGVLCGRRRNGVAGRAAGVATCGSARRPGQPAAVAHTAAVSTRM